MHAPVQDASEYGDCTEDLFADDAVPDTLRHLLAYIADEFCDEVLAWVGAIDRWLAEHDDIAEGEVVGGRPTRRFLGTTDFEWRGRPMTISVVPYRVFVLQRLQDAVGAMAPGDAERTRALFAEVGLEPLLSVRPRRRVERRDNREVWGPAQTPVTG
jgi:hypothetical protein